MEYVCKKCNYWNQEAPVVQDKENMGECERLSHVTDVVNPEFILPVLNDGKPVSDGRSEIEFITMAHFGCNQFSEAA